MVLMSHSKIGQGNASRKVNKKARRAEIRFCGLFCGWRAAGAAAKSL